MGFLVVILTLALIGVVAAIVSAPLRRGRDAEGAGRAREASEHGGQADARHGGQPPGQVHTRDQMEAAREAKYREIRDTELDFRTGKLSREDYQSIDADLRGEAIEILNELEELEIPPGESNGSSGAGSAGTVEE